MPKITFLPINRTIEVPVGQTILESAIDNDIPLQHACGGFCSCTTCQVRVKDGMERLSSVEEMERERIDESADKPTPQSRLGCQTRVMGDCTVEIVHLDY